MAPLSFSIPSILRRASFNPGLPSDEFSSQWTNPGDVFSVLLILGGDVVARALAQVAGTGLTPVTFSFGWVAYAVNAVVSTVGENKLMPLPDCACKIINGNTGYVRDNTSWVLGRIMRDYESWMHSDVSQKVKSILDEKHKKMKADADKDDPGSGTRVARPTQAGLCVSFYRAKSVTAGARHWDVVYGSGFVTAILQLGVAAIPCGIWGDWSILLITTVGILLAFLSGSLRQWRTEKWSCRRNDKSKTVVLTRGNGAQHAIVISDPDKLGFDLETLAAGQMNVDVSASMSTRALVVVLAVFWILLLVSASGIKSNTWFLLAVGGMGIVQNIFVAGWRRKPEAFGIPLEFQDVVGKPKVMETLFEVEKAHPELGASMRETFFPGKLRPEEEKEWEGYKAKAEELKKQAKEQKKRQAAQPQNATQGPQGSPKLSASSSSQPLN